MHIGLNESNVSYENRSAQCGGLTDILPLQNRDLVQLKAHPEHPFHKFDFARVRTVPTDGNCGYHCLWDALQGSSVLELVLQRFCPHIERAGARGGVLRELFASNLMPGYALFGELRDVHGVPENILKRAQASAQLGAHRYDAWMFEDELVCLAHLFQVQIHRYACPGPGERNNADVQWDSFLPTGDALQCCYIYLKDGHYSRLQNLQLLPEHMLRQQMEHQNISKLQRSITPTITSMEVQYGENEGVAPKEGQAPTFGAKPVQVNIPAPLAHQPTYDDCVQLETVFGRCVPPTFMGNFELVFRSNDEDEDVAPFDDEDDAAIDFDSF